MMYFVDNMKQILESLSYYPKFNFQLDDAHHYKIEMCNKFLDKRGKVLKTQSLVTHFSKKIVSVPYEIIGLTDITIDKVEYTAKPGDKPMRWTFAEGLVLPHYLFYCHYLDDFSTVAYESENEDGLIAIQKKNFQDAFKKFPKLYSVYLLIMQVYDIAAFDIFASHFFSKPTLFEEPGKASEITSLSASECSIGMGLYSDSSYFRNGFYQAIFHGFTYYNQRLCGIVEYFCDESKVKVIDNAKGMDNIKDGSSYYSGYVYFDVESGMPVSGTMLESVIATQSKGENSEVPVHIRRRIKMDLVDSEG